MVQITITFFTHFAFALISLMPLCHLHITVVRDITIMMTAIVASAENTIIRTSCCPIELLASAAVNKIHIVRCKNHGKRDLYTEK